MTRVVGTQMLFDALGGVSPSSVARFAFRQVLTDVFLGWMANRMSDEPSYDEACLYPFIPWMNTAQKRDTITRVLGGVQEVDLSSLTPGSLIAFFGDVRVSAGIDPEQWATRLRVELSGLATLRLRDLIAGLFPAALVPGPVPAAPVQTVLQAALAELTDGWVPNSPDLLAIGAVRAWIRDARDARFTNPMPDFLR